MGTIKNNVERTRLFFEVLRRRERACL